MKNKIARLVIFGLMFASGIHASEINLIDLPIKQSQVGAGELTIGANWDQYPVFLKGKEINNYIFAHASSWILYDIPAGMTSFSAWGVRVHPDDNVQGSWFYVVKIDGQEAFRSNPLMNYVNCEVPINVSIPSGSKQIELIVDSMGDIFADHSVWALPKFTSRPAFASGTVQPGFYSGILTVTKSLLPEGLSTKFTLKSQARVTSDGQVTILSTVPESPAAAADPESAVTRAVPSQDSANNYLVDGQIPANLTGSGKQFTLTYSPSSLTSGTGTPSATTTFSFAFHRRGQ